MERGSSDFLVFPFSLVSPCAFANLSLAVRGVSVLSLDSLDEDGTGADGRERECDREWEGESAGVEGPVRERQTEECASERIFSNVMTSFCTSLGYNHTE